MLTLRQVFVLFVSKSMLRRTYMALRFVAA
jgi:hypothetical protein